MTAVTKESKLNTHFLCEIYVEKKWFRLFLKMFSNHKIPGVKGTEQEDNQSHDSLSVPPLDVWS